MGRILLVDDDDQLRDSFYNILSMEGHDVRTASSGEAALRLAEQDMPDAVIMDVRMPGLDGLATLRLLHEQEPRMPVIIMTAYSTTEAAIEATKLGAFDYILKPFDIPDILTLLGKALEAGRVMRERVILSEGEPEPEDSDALVGVGRAMHEVYKAIGRVAPTDALVLLRGESGTGKELVARALYQHSMRAARPFTIINCVAIPDTLLESELFGYERGAFTGAHSRHIGKIEQAENGTVFLDEIGDMPVSIQAKLLRLLQEKKVERLGGREPIRVDVRIIAATNRDLEQAVEQGRFREDLYYRLNVVSLHLPPLRERSEDIPHLARHFVRTISREMGIPAPEISQEGMERLQAHSWPGNVRELGNLLRKVLIFNQGSGIVAEDVTKALLDSASGKGPENVADTPPGVLTDYIRRMLMSHSGDNTFDTIMDSVGSRLIKQALELCGNNRTHTARMLGLSRPTLLAKIEKYRL